MVGLRTKYMLTNILINEIIDVVKNGETVNPVLKFHLYSPQTFKPLDIDCSTDTSDKLSRVVRKPAFCICENKDADQLRGNREADQRLCFRHIDTVVQSL